MVRVYMAVASIPGRVHTVKEIDAPVRLPAYERYRRRMEYEKAESDVEEMTEIEVDPGTLVETETAPVENLPLPFGRRWIHYGLTISVSLLLLLLAWLGFRQLRRMAREKNER